MVNAARKIWSHAAHNAFTDLARFKGSWYCVFRESRDHMRGVGRVRVLQSVDGEHWSDCGLISQRGVDLRDPKLSATPFGNLMLLAGGTVFKEDRYVGRQPRIAFSSDGTRWTKLETVLEDGDWLWRITWHGARAYGITYRLESPEVWRAFLVSSRDGVHYDEICDLEVSGKPNEATIRFRPNGEAVALVRREGKDKKGWVGTSKPPYNRWSWRALEYRLGGPNFLVLPDGSMVASTRVIRGDEARTVVGPLTESTFNPLIELPSGGDCSYPGMVHYRNRIWISYYSSHERKSSIYLAKLPLKACTER